jgi:hypothetical protein
MIEKLEKCYADRMNKVEEFYQHIEDIVQAYQQRYGKRPPKQRKDFSYSYFARCLSSLDDSSHELSTRAACESVITRAGKLMESLQKKIKMLRACQAGRKAEYQEGSMRFMVSLRRPKVLEPALRLCQAAEEHFASISASVGGANEKAEKFGEKQQALQTEHGGPAQPAALAAVAEINFDAIIQSIQADLYDKISAIRQAANQKLSSLPESHSCCFRCGK